MAHGPRPSTLALAAFGFSACYCRSPPALVPYGKRTPPSLILQVWIVGQVVATMAGMEDVFKLLGFHSLGILLGGTLFLFADAFAKHQSPLKKALYGPLTGTEIRVCTHTLAKCRRRHRCCKCKLAGLQPGRATQMTTPRRRWFRFAFSLRTLFIVVTVVAFALGWQLSIVRERHAIIAEIRRTGGTLWDDGVSEAYDDEFNEIEGYRVSAFRRLLGDKTYRTVYIPPPIGAEWIERAELAFPEAELYLDDGKGRIVDWVPTIKNAPFRDSLYRQAFLREPNTGSIFKTGLIEK